MEYLPFDADLVFLDTRQFLEQPGLMDETVLIESLLSMAKNLLPSSMLIILTAIMVLDAEFLEQLHANHIVVVYQRRRNDSADYNLFLLQTRRLNSLAEIAVSAMGRAMEISGLIEKKDST